MAKHRSRKPQVMQNEVLSRTLAAQSKSQIARDLGIDRQTVTRIQECHNLPQLLSDTRQYMAEHVVPDAVESVHAQILDRDSPGDGNLAVRVLEGVGVLGGEEPPRQVVLDERVQIAVARLPWASRADAQPRQLPAPESASRPALGDACGAPGDSGDAAAPTQVIAPAPKPSEPINIVTGKHDRWCRCRDCLRARCGSVPASPAQAEPMPKPAQPGHTGDDSRGERNAKSPKSEPHGNVESW